MIVGVDQFFILFSNFSEGGELFDHVIGGLQFGAEVADLPFVHFYDLVQVVELRLHCQMRVLVCVFGKLFDQFVDLLYFLLVLLLL